MTKFTISALIFTLQILSYSLADNPATVVNNCELAKCASCKKVSENYSCSECHHSMKIADPDNQGLFKCKHHNPVPNCQLLKETAEYISSETECVTCEVGYSLSKDKNSCTKLKTKCLATIQRSVSVDDLKCEFCWPGYVPSSDPEESKKLICSKIDKDKLLENCRFYKEDGRCLKCNHGYYLETVSVSVNKCVKDAEEKISKCLNPTSVDAQKNCANCDYFRGYWPIKTAGTGTTTDY